MANKREQSVAQSRIGISMDTLMLCALLVLIALSTINAKPVQVPVQSEIADATSEKAVEEAIATLEVSEPVSTAQAVVSELPDFAAITNVHEKKQSFFKFLLPQVRAANDKIRDERRYLLRLRDLTHESQLNATQLKELASIAKRYRVAPTGSIADTISALLLRVDVVPESLVLAQAANESGWGTSRFARQANNLFGVWCFSPGCGLPPLRRDEGLTHEVASYSSIQVGIEAYLHTLNTNLAYVELRHIRADSRADEAYISGLAMAEGLLKYSARGADYVREIQAMIRVNNLQRFTRPVQV